MGGLSEGSDGEGVVCASCGTEARAAAVFCRACGARLESRPEPAQAPGPVGPEATPGGSRPEPAARRPAAPPPPKRTGPRRGLTALLVVAACLVLGALVGGAAYMLTSDDSTAVDGPEPPQPIGIGSGGGTSTTTTTVPDETDGDDGGDDAEGGGGQGSGSSDLEAGRYIQAGSFRLSENAEEEVGRLQAAGIDVFTIPSAEGDELLPGFQVLLVGPLDGDREERRVLADLRRARVSGIRKDLTPSPTISGPEDAAGAWSGDLELSNSDRPRFDAEVRVRISIDSDGLGGSVGYRFQGCRGSLSLTEESDVMLSYEESLRVGRCPAGGVWYLRPSGEEMIATGLYEDSDMILHGTVERE